MEVAGIEPAYQLFPKKGFAGRSNHPRLFVNKIFYYNIGEIEPTDFNSVMKYHKILIGHIVYIYPLFFPRR